MTKPKILFYDIETTPLRAWIWRLGKQHVRHGQLDRQYNMYDIICITYCWNDGKRAKSLDIAEYTTASMIAEFDELVAKSDITIGKNSDRFDVKQINSQRMLHGLAPTPDWMKYTDDLEKQMRKYFYLPSYGLDYSSDLLGLGGKDKMEFQDWIDIVECNPGWEKKLKKMVKYGKKDVEDTREIWNRCKDHFEVKYNAGLGTTACKHCGSTDIAKNGTRQSGKTKYQRYQCNAHGGYAGRAPINKKGVPGSVLS